jgi:hypothetical protein
VGLTENQAAASQHLVQKDILIVKDNYNP